MSELRRGSVSRFEDMNMNTTATATADKLNSVSLDKRENIRVAFTDATGHRVEWVFTPALTGRLLHAVERAVHEGRRAVGAGIVASRTRDGSLRLRTDTYDVLLTGEQGIALEHALERAYHERRSTVGGMSRAEAEEAAAEGTPEGLAALEAWRRAGIEE